MDDDCTSIMNNKPMQAPGEEGLRDIRIVERCINLQRVGSE